MKNKLPRGAGVTILACLTATAGALIALGLAAQFDWFAERARIATVRVETNERETAAAAPRAGAFDPIALYEERSPGVVTIYAAFAGSDDPQGAAQGSGFVVSDSGLILTNSHVITTAGLSSDPDAVTAASAVFVEFSDGERMAAEIVGWDVFADVAVLATEAPKEDLRPLPLGVSVEVQVGESVAAIGSPFGQSGSLTVGVVSATGRSVASLTSDYDLVDAIQIDAPINRGNSGGPLFNAHGEVIGINAQIRSETGTAEGVGFAIPIAAAWRSMQQLVESGAVAYPWIGTCTATLVPGIAQDLGYSVERGALITAVFGDTPAEEAGLQEGEGEQLVDGIRYTVGSDVVVALDAREIGSADALIRELARHRPGDTVALDVWRGDESLALELTVGERPLKAPGLC